jgi:elongation factor Ts
MTITTEQIKELRQTTGAGVLDVKHALEATGGDMEAATAILREKGMAKAAKKAARVASEGHVHAYIHGGGRVGVLVEVNCETDFVARTEGFQQLVHEVAMQIAATSPRFVAEADIPEGDLAARRADVLAQAQTEAAGAAKPKPPEVMMRIVDGKMAKWLDEVVLLRQPYIRDDSQTMGQLVTSAIGRIGENIVVRRFARFELGDFGEQV